MARLPQGRSFQLSFHLLSALVLAVLVTGCRQASVPTPSAATRQASTLPPAWTATLPPTTVPPAPTPTPARDEATQASTRTTTIPPSIDQLSVISAENFSSLRSIANADLPSGWPVAWSPNQATIAIRAADATLNLYTLPSFEHETLKVGLDPEAISFSPDGSVLVTYGKGGVKAWDVVAGDLEWQATGPCAAAVESMRIAFSPDARWIAAGDFSLDEVTRVRLFRSHNCLEVGQPVRRDGVLREIRFSPDSEYMVVAAETGPNDGMSIWTVDDLRKVCDLPYALSVPAFAAPGKRIAALANKGGIGIGVWDLPACRERGFLQYPDAFMFAFGPLGDFLLAIGGSDVSAFDLESTRSMGMPADIPSKLLYAYFSANGRLLVTASAESYNSDTYEWDVWAIFE